MNAIFLKTWKCLLLSALSLCIVGMSLSLAQDEEGLSRKEKRKRKRALKKEIKAYKKNPEQFAQYKQEKAQAEAALASTQSELNQVEQQRNELTTEKQQLESDKAELERKLQACQNKPEGFTVPTSGTFYVVQIGAFQESNAPVNPDNPDLRKDFQDGYNKYIMGVFDNIQQADELKNFLLQLDFRSDPSYRPFVAPYRDGQRVNLADVLPPDQLEQRRQQNDTNQY